MWLSWKWCNMHAYQVSSPCVLPLESLRRSTWSYLNNNVVVIEICSCHVIRMCTKFHLHAVVVVVMTLHMWLAICTFLQNFMRLFVVIQTKWLSWKSCYTHAYQVSSPCVVPLASLRSEEVILKKSAWGYLLLFTNMYCCDFDVGYWIHCVYKLSLA